MTDPKTNNDIARAFSEHRFDQAVDHLSEHVVWNLVGMTRLEGRDAVVTACHATAADASDTTTTWLRFVSTGEGDTVAVDAIARYADPHGVTTVSSCDIYEFTDGSVDTITSYACEVDPDNPFQAANGGD